MLFSAYYRRPYKVKQLSVKILEGPPVRGNKWRRGFLVRLSPVPVLTRLLTLISASLSFVPQISTRIILYPHQRGVVRFKLKYVKRWHMGSAQLV